MLIPISVTCMPEPHEAQAFKWACLQTPDQSSSASMAESRRAGVLRHLWVTGQPVHSPALLQADPACNHRPCMSLGPTCLCCVCFGLSRLLLTLWRGMLLPSATSTRLRPNHAKSKPRQPLSLD